MKIKELIESNGSADAILSDYPTFCKQWNITSSIKKIGSGNFGTVYDIGNSKILKTTSDRNEATASSYSMGKKLKYTWKVDFVGIFKAGKFRNQFVIIGEKLNKLSGKDVDIFDELYETAFGSGNFDDDFKRTKNYNDWLNYMKDNEKQFRSAYKDMVKYPKHAEWEYKALKELLDSGIQYGDNHGENILKGGSSWKFVDLGGWSKSPVGKIERINENQGIIKII